MIPAEVEYPAAKESSPVCCSWTATFRTVRSGADPFLLRYFDLLEEAGFHEPLLGPLDHHLVVGIALSDPEFAADYLIPGGDIAGEIDALDIFALAPLDGVDDGDRPRFGIAVYSGAIWPKGSPRSAAAAVSASTLFSMRSAL